MIKAVIFDWGGVLIDDAAPGMLIYLARSLGVTPQALNNAYKSFAPAFQKGMIAEDALWHNVCAELKVKKPYSSSLWHDAFRYAYAPRTEMFDLASRVKNSGYKVALLSNTETPTMQYFREQHYDMFDVAVFSCAEGTRKPERRIYEIALERLNVNPDEAVLIDDRVDFIEGAKEVGINTILFKNPEQVNKELLSFSVRTQ